MSPLCMRSVRADDAQVIAPNDKDTCLACHGDKVNGQHFASSAHGRLSCQVCHAGIDRYPHPAQAVAQMPVCTTCHAIKAASLAKSVHQHADRKTHGTLACQACHGNNAHEITEASKLAPEQQIAPCTTCHRKVVSALQASVHGYSGNKSDGTRPNCLFCHGSNPHEISPPTAVSAPPRDQSCRTCHTDIAKMLSDSAHGQLGTESANRLSCLTCHGKTAHTVVLPKHTSAAEFATVYLLPSGSGPSAGEQRA